MDKHARFIAKRLKEAEKVLEAKADAVAAAQSEYYEARSLYDSLHRVLASLTGDAPPEPVEVIRGVLAPTITELALEVIYEEGPMTSKQLALELRTRGKPNTTGNSVNTTLSRFRPDRFDKDKQGRWFLPPRKEAGQKK